MKIEPKCEEYRLIAERYARTRVDKRLPCGMPIHAAVLIEMMFETALSEMRIYAKDLSELVFCRPEVLQAAVNFAAKPHTSLKILLEKKPCENWADTHPLIKALKGRDIYGEIEVLFAAGNYAEGDAEHFAVLDKRGFRFEFDHYKCKAVANFNDPDIAKNLASTFDKAFLLAKEKRNNHLIFGWPDSPTQH